MGEIIEIICTIGLMLAFALLLGTVFLDFIGGFIVDFVKAWRNLRDRLKDDAK